MTPRSGRISIFFALFIGLVSAQTSTRVNVGGPQYTDSSGNVWVADTGCSTAQAYSSGHSISGTNDATLYQTGRQALAFSCTYTVTGPAFYYVTVRFAETDPAITTRNPRIFNVFVNNVLQRQVNIVGSGSAPYTAYDLTFGPIAVYDTTINILFSSVSNNAEVQAIDIESIGTLTGQQTFLGYGNPGPFCTAVLDGVRFMTSDALHEQAGIDCVGDYFVRSSAGGTYAKKAAIFAGNSATGQGIDLSSDASINWHSGTDIDSSSDDTCIVRSAPTVILGTTLTTNICDPAAVHSAFSGKAFIFDPSSESRPTCDSTKRGWQWGTRGGAGVADTVAVCAKDNTDTYAWRTIY